MRQMSGLRVGVIMGGWSAEHDVSIDTGNAVAEALSERGHEVVRIVVPASNHRSFEGASNLMEALGRAEIDVAFLALHGRFGEDGCVQGLLELAGIPYTGTGVMASALAMDKAKSKELFLLHNVPTPPYYKVAATEDLADIESVHRHFGFPAIVKPRGEGSSLAVRRVNNLSELVLGLQEVFAVDDWALVERYVAGVEVNVGILEGRVLGAIEICPKSGIYDYEAKYTPGASTYHVPARLQPARFQNVLNLALRAVEALDVQGAARVDMLVTPGDNEYVLEVNTLPGMTETSLLPKIAQAAGYSFADLCDAILSNARLHTPQRREALRNSATLLKAPAIEISKSWEAVG
jgi:D-alanine-D-alanine ligase